MTQFLVIEPATRSVRAVECETADEAIRVAGLTPNGVDHGMITPHLGIIVDEFGLFAKPNAQHYTGIGGRLYAGNAVVYGVGDEGETVDAMDAHAFGTACIFLHGESQVEGAIRRNVVFRPQMTINGQVIWQWPAPRPEVDAL